MTGEIWVFGYGSLIWCPGIRSLEKKDDVLDGWHRDWTRISSSRYGAPTCSLYPGGKVKGRFYKLDPKTQEEDLTTIKAREGKKGEEVSQSGFEGRILIWKMGNNLNRFYDLRGLDGEKLYNALAKRAIKVIGNGIDGKNAVEYAFAVHEFDPDDEITSMYVKEIEKILQLKKE